MFSFFKKKPQPRPPYADKRWFINEIFEKIRETENPNDKIKKYIYVYECVKDLELEFGIESLELEFVRDDIADTFQEATDLKVLLSSALAYGLFLDKFKEIAEIYGSELPEHLKLRLLRLHIEAKLGFQKIDPLEFSPDLQNAFYEVEKRKLFGIEKRRVLEEEFGIKGWRSSREMNPDIIYD